MKAISKTCKRVLNGEISNGISHLRNHTLLCLVRKLEINQTLIMTYSFDHEGVIRELATTIILHKYAFFKYNGAHWV